MSNKLTDSVRYFFNQLEKEAQKVEALNHIQTPEEQIDFEKIEQFFRTLKGLDIYMFTVGVNGKLESAPFPKLIFSLGRMVRIYYSLSLDNTKAGFIRVRKDETNNLVIIERLHGYRPKVEQLYASKNPCHIIRFITRWIIKRIDWNRTKLKGLDLYNAYREIEDKMRQRKEARHAEEHTARRLKEIINNVDARQKARRRSNKPRKKLKG